ncbi:hypothetical protein ACUIJQ_08380 [Levilactobacillus hammesii]|uniref:hypothetical protein n=1 Tax=Levilactobacillus hammesii TaxID=267633 RepID=UPI000AC593E3|nr:hypothetical protein [Levilactobacillus hammesii]
MEAIIKVVFGDGKKEEVPSDSALEEAVIRRKSYVRAFHFKQPEVIRADTGTTRDHVNTETWNVKWFRSGIVVYPRPNKRKLPGVLIYWNQIAWAEAENDPAADDESYRWW